jgi:hypothetical protein
LTDAVFELTVDAIERQVTAALINDPGNKWGQLFKDLCMAAPRVISSKRGGSGEAGAHWAARQVVFQVLPMFEPLPGLIPEVIENFLAAALNEPSMTLAASYIADVLSGGQIVSWKQAQAYLGTTERAVRDIGLAPPDVVIPDQQEAPPLVQVTSPVEPNTEQVVEGVP